MYVFHQVEFSNLISIKHVSQLQKIFLELPIPKQYTFDVLYQSKRPCTHGRPTSAKLKTFYSPRTQDVWHMLKAYSYFITEFYFTCLPLPTPAPSPIKKPARCPLERIV